MLRPGPLLQVVLVTTLAVLVGRAIDPFDMIPDESQSSVPEQSTLPPLVAPSTVTLTGRGASCFPSALANGAEVVVLGAYEGKAESPVTYASSDHKVGRISVQASEKGPPLLLVLSAYDPVLWDFAGFPMNRLRAVLVTGYEDQAVARLPARIPLARSTYGDDNDGPRACIPYASVYNHGAALRTLDASLRKRFGRGVDRFNGAYGATALHADGGLVRAVPSAPERRDIRGAPLGLAVVSPFG